MKMKGIISTTFLASFFLFSCGGSSADETGTIEDTVATEEAVVVPVEVTWNDLETDAVEPETVIIFEGYIGDLGSYIDQSNGQIRIPLYERRNQGAGFKMNLYIPIGTSPNCIKELPAQFTPSDYQIVCDDEKIVSLGDKVRITATKSETYSEGFITADVIKIEAIESTFDPTILASAVALTTAMVNDTTVLKSYSYIDAKLEIPSIVFSYTNDISLDLKGSSVKDVTSVSVRLGDGPSSMNDLPDNYTNKDLIVRDYNGDQIKYGTTLRLYGTWERYSFESTSQGKFYLEEIEVKK